MRMRVNSVSYGAGAHIAMQCAEGDYCISEFAYLPKHEEKPVISAKGFMKLLMGLAAIAVAVSLTRLKMPWKQNSNMMNMVV